VAQDGGRHGRITEPHTLYAHEELLFIEFQGKKGLMCTRNDNLPASEWAILNSVVSHQSSVASIQPWQTTED
jgi:hypothetical protein